MTTEILIMNKLAIALAADSAVTFREIQGDKTRQKIYQTANKLFMFSKYKPIGIMVYGSSDLNNVPWEIIIKLFRNHLGSKSFRTLEGYLKFFIEFVNRFFNDEDQRRMVNERVFGFLYLSIRKKIEDHISSSTSGTNTNLKDSDNSSLTTQIIKDNYDWLLGLDYALGLDQDFQDSLISLYHDQIFQIIKQTFEGIYISGDNEQLLLKITGLLLTKKVFPDDASGLVIAGYGDNEYFPSMYDLTVDCVVNGKLKFDTKHFYDITLDRPSVIQPFAIEDMVDTFLYGIDPLYNNFIDDYMKRMLGHYPEILVNNIPQIAEPDKKAILEVLTQKGEEIYKDFRNEFDRKITDNYVSPIRTALNILPKDELANMAEMLVNLTSVKKRVSMQDEIVGGPIDVAVLSKSDGFVWIKRKHYFSPTLNHHFFENYYNECNNGEG